jgi:hypothetical protein
MDSNITDPSFQKAAAATALFDSAGWKDYEDRVIALVEAENLAINQLTSKIVLESEREKINFHIAKLTGLAYLASVKQEMIYEYELQKQDDVSPVESEQNNLQE